MARLRYEYLVSSLLYAGILVEKMAHLVANWLYSLYCSISPEPVKNKPLVITANKTFFDIQRSVYNMSQLKFLVLEVQHFFFTWSTWNHS